MRRRRALLSGTTPMPNRTYLDRFALPQTHRIPRVVTRRKYAATRNLWISRDFCRRHPPAAVWPRPLASLMGGADQQGSEPWAWLACKTRTRRPAMLACLVRGATARTENAAAVTAGRDRHRNAPRPPKRDLSTCGKPCPEPIAVDRSSLAGTGCGVLPRHGGRYMSRQCPVDTAERVGGPHL